MRISLLLLLLLVAVLVTGCPKRVAEAPPADAGAQAAAIETSAPSVVEARDAGAVVNEAPAPVPPPAREAGTGDACTSDAQCPDGTVCEGCSNDDRRCIPGCRTDKDCQAPEKCQRVECVRCPCPSLCGI